MVNVINYDELEHRLWHYLQGQGQCYTRQNSVMDFTQPFSRNISVMHVSVCKSIINMHIMILTLIRRSYISSEAQYFTTDTGGWWLTHIPDCLRSGLSWFIWWVSFAPEFQCCYLCESSCLFYLSFNSDFYVYIIMNIYAIGIFHAKPNN